MYVLYKSAFAICDNVSEFPMLQIPEGWILQWKDRVAEVDINLYGGHGKDLIIVTSETFLMDEFEQMANIVESDSLSVFWFDGLIATIKERKTDKITQIVTTDNDEERSENNGLKVIRLYPVANRPDAFDLHEIFAVRLRIIDRLIEEKKYY